MMKQLIPLYFFVLAISTCLAQNTTISASCGKCYKKVAASSKIGDYCPHCGVRWGYENTSTTTSSVSNGATSLYKVPNSGSLQSSNSGKQPKPQSQQQESTASKAETEKWLLAKLNAYCKERTGSSSGLLIGGPKTYWTYKYEYYTFEDYYLIFDEIAESEGKIFSRERVRIPIYDIESLNESASELTIRTNNETISETNISTGKKQVTSIVFVGFVWRAETDLAMRMERAFMHLKKFYSKPPNKEPF